MKIINTARVLTLCAMLPFAVCAATSASAEDDQNEGGAAKGAVKGAVGAEVLGLDAKKGAAVGATAGAVKKNDDDDKSDKKDE